MRSARLLVILAILASSFIACAATGDRLRSAHLEQFAASSLSSLEANQSFPDDSDFTVAIVTSTDVPPPIVTETSFANSQQLSDAFYDAVVRAAGGSPKHYRAQSRQVFASYCAAAGIKDPWELSMPAKQRAFSEIAEERGQRIDYFLIMRIAAEIPAGVNAIEYRTSAELTPASGDLAQIVRGNYVDQIERYSTVPDNLGGAVGFLIACLKPFSDLLQYLNTSFPQQATHPVPFQLASHP